MAILEEMGLLYQPYTSAGTYPDQRRLPLLCGQRLMGEDQLPQHIQEMIRHQFYQADMTVDDWLSLSASVLAQHSQGAAIVTPLHTDKARLKHLALLSTRGRQVLMVLVLNSGEVHQQTLVLDDTLTPGRPDRDSRSDQQSGWRDDRGRIKQAGGNWNRTRKPLMDVICQTCLADHAESEVVSTGKCSETDWRICSPSPSFLSRKKPEQTLGVFEDRAMLDDLLSRTVFDSETPGVHVIIGGEDTWEQLEDCSLIIASYGYIGHAMGASRYHGTAANVLQSGRINCTDSCLI